MDFRPEGCPHARERENSTLTDSISPIVDLISPLFAYEGWLPRPWSWLVVLGALLVFLLVLGIWMTHQPLGVLINERNLMSLSRLQIICWSIVILSSYIVVVMQRIAGHVPNPLGVTVDNQLWAILGISTASFVGAPLVPSTKTDKSPSDNAIRAASKALGEAPVSIQQNAQGTLYSNSEPDDARFSGIFEEDEVGNTAYVDISKVQMFLITVLLIGVYCSALWSFLSGAHDQLTKLPPANGDMLFALSHAGYLTFKTSVTPIPRISNELQENQLWQLRLSL
jgi:hypothetical protein